MAISSPTHSETYIQALPTFAQAAEVIGVSPSWVTRAVKTLEIEPVAWGRREKHLNVADVLRLGIYAKRQGLEAMGGALLDSAEQNHPDQAEAIRAEIDEFYDSLPKPQPTPPEEFIAQLRAMLPPAAAEAAVESYVAERRRIQKSPV